MAPMEIRYSATPDDVSAVFWHNLRHSSRFRLVLAGLALYPAALIAIVALIARSHITVRGMLAGLAIGLLTLVALPLITRLRTKRDERVLLVDAHGIQTSIGKLSGQVPWSRVASVSITPEHVFITGKNANAFAIPSRAFATEEVRLAFVHQVSAFRGNGHQPPAI